MVDVSGFIGTIESIFNLIRGLIDHRRDRQDDRRDRQVERRDRQVELVNLLISVKKAIAASRKELAHRYDGVPKVPELWEKVLILSVVLDRPDFIETATDKFEFWSDPDLYLDNPDLLKAVPQLEEFEKVCDEILRKLRTL